MDALTIFLIGIIISITIYSYHLRNEITHWKLRYSKEHLLRLGGETEKEDFSHYEQVLKQIRENQRKKEK